MGIVHTAQFLLSATQRRFRLISPIFFCRTLSSSNPPRFIARSLSRLRRLRVNRQHGYRASRLSESNDLPDGAFLRAVSNLRRCNHHLPSVRVDTDRSHGDGRKRKSLEEDN